MVNETDAKEKIDIETIYANMSINERKRVWEANKGNIKMTFKEWNERLPKPNKKIHEFYKK